ncbi:hypothetical protein QIG50_28175, partial [Klebsiella pneumoniae]|nr:hypothetical protein [Klebsiella pneumoniae]
INRKQIRRTKNAQEKKTYPCIAGLSAPWFAAVNWVWGLGFGVWAETVININNNTSVNRHVFTDKR